MSPAEHKTRAYLSLAAICIIWGTTYTAIKYAVRDFPPYLLVGIRQTSAGLLLLGLALAGGKLIWPGRPYAMRQALTGVATITGGNGFITWGMQYVSSGLAAIIGSLTPVMVVLISLAWRSPERINPRMIAGVLMGFGGLGIIFNDGWQDFLKPEYRWGIAGCFASCFTWSLGTVMAKRWNSPEVPPLLNAGMQITAGGLGGFILSVLFDKSHTIHHTAESWISMLYLITIGSALAFTLYMYALKHLSATVSSLYTYINPMVAIVLGWALLGESLTTGTILGMTVTITGVWLVNRGAR
ncbi:MAG: EamA family transporter [Haliscomenobacteraceae bacterium CHB4]|nr:putative inner membrane transporter YedA [Saprospiraceae bacterium]MCE7923328.1 EamA family transporter [Haliscomenobacteraceae bacterium CHB4]